MIIHLKEEFEDEMLGKFLDFCNLCPLEETKEIYLCSPGGDLNVMSAIASVINKNPESFSMTAVGKISSAAFMLFYSVKCKRELSLFCRGMLHLPMVEVLINAKGIISYHDSHRKQLESDFKMHIEYAKTIGLNAKELKKFEDGKDVEFDYYRMQQLLNYQLKQ